MVHPRRRGVARLAPGASRHGLLLAFATFTTLPSLLAQEAADRLLASVRMTGVPEIVRHWPESRVGRLFADAEVAPAVAELLGWMRRQRARYHAVLEAAVELGVEVEPHVLASLLLTPDAERIFDRPFEELRSFEALALAGTGQEMGPPWILRYSCLPRYEGRWTMEFERQARIWERSPWFDADREAKIGGVPALALTVKGTDEPQDFPLDGPKGLWMQHLPGRFLTGSGSVEEAGRLRLPPTEDVPRFVTSVAMRPYLRLFDRIGGAPQEFRILGLAGLERLEWRVGFAGEHLLDEVELRFDGEPEGVLGALLDGDAPLPAQALPEGALLQVRTAVDVGRLIDAIRGLAGDALPVTEAEQKTLAESLTGGVAFAVGAPAGGAIPRLYLSLGVADEAALGKLLQDWIAPLASRQVSYGGVPCTLLSFDGMPQGLQPAFCIHDGRLHVAESGRSLRALLKAQASGAIAMDLGDAPEPGPGGAGDKVPYFDLRWDEAAIYAAYRKTWLPLYVLSGIGRNDSALELADLPPADAVAKYCGKARGVLRRAGNRYTLQCLGTLGSPWLAALAMAYGPMMTGPDYRTEELQRAVARHRLQEVWPELEAFKRREQRWPKDLAELFAAQRLEEDALLVPGDDLAEEVTLRDGRKVRSSFRYFPTPLEVKAAGAGQSLGRMLLIEIRTQPWNRSMLDDEGRIPDVWGEVCAKPIDEFGK